MPRLEDMTGERVELGCAGHFIGAADCFFRRHTQVGLFRISSVGDYWPDRDGKRREVGCGRFFETMVFKTTNVIDPENDGCGCRVIEEWCEIDGDAYQTAGEAQAGHEAMVEKYIVKARDAQGGAEDE